MQKNWYAVYTKPNCEKKVSGLLAKKKIKSFCPVHCRQIIRYNRMKLVYEPLFSSYVFVYMDESEIIFVKQLNHVINLVYWKGQPAIIQNEEIEEIKEFVTYHHNIRLEISRVNLDSPVPVIEPPSYSVDGNVVMIKNKFIKVDFPSLGYRLVAEMEEEGVMGRQAAVRNKGLLLFK